MNFANKIIQLRKQAGWSQEELAEKMSVTRQSVSKWESDQSVPDLEKIVQLSEMFHVSTDYLLKDRIENMNDTRITETASTQKYVTREEANTFLAIKAYTSKSIAYATLLCIISPICLFTLGAISESPNYNLAENIAIGIGMIVLLILVAIAVVVFISSSGKTASFEYLEKETFETESGVKEMVREQKNEYKSTYIKKNMIGVCLCIIAIIPLFAGLMWDEKNDLLLTAMLSTTLILAGLGVVFLVHNGIIWASYEKLLQEGDYTAEKKSKASVTSAVNSAYWLVATAIYLAYSLTTNNWRSSWIIWVVAGILFPAMIAIMNVLNKRRS